MFSFIKKGEKKSDDKSKDQVDQNQNKERRLKIRRSKAKDKLPSGITADYSAPFFAKLDVYQESNRDTAEEFVSVNTTLSMNDNNSLILSQTEYAETSSKNHVSTPKMQSAKYTTSFLQVKTSPSMSTESLSDSTNSIFTTPPLSPPIGEAHGFSSIPKSHSLQELNLPMPAIKLIDLPKPRRLTISRQNNAQKDFGFSLRKANIVLNRSNLQSPLTFKSVIFAEPGTNCKTTGLLPGDRLISINEITVEDLPREEIIDMIKKSGETVNVVVQPVAELSELSKRCMPSTENDQMDYNTLKRSASKRLKVEKMRNNNPDDISTVEEQVWINFNTGFCKGYARKIQSGEPIGKLQVRFLHNNEKIIIDEDDVEKSNPEFLDFCEDISQLKYLNETSVLNTLRQRYANNLIHTYAGAKNLIVLNPMLPLSLYSEKVVSMFRGCKADFGILDMPPHIYSLTQSTYSEMLQTRKNQSIIFMGRSGAGKTTNFKHSILYLTLSAGSVQKFLTVEKVNAIQLILEFFGNTTNILNSNATRFTQVFSLDFDNGVIASASTQIFLMEGLRVGKSFQILRLLAGLSDTFRKSLYLDNLQDNPFMQGVSQKEERDKAAIDFDRINKAFSILSIEKEAIAIWNILAAIYHLGIASVVDAGYSSGTRIQFSNTSAATKAASLLGVSMDNLRAAAFDISPQRLARDDALNAAWESLEVLVSGLYSTAMSAVVSLINNKMTLSSAHTNTSIYLIDSPGFQNPATSGKQAMATLIDMKHNYFQERLQLLFKNVMDQKRKLYLVENVEIDTEEVSDLISPLISLLDKSPPNISSLIGQQETKRGLFWLLEEESMNTKSNDETFLDTVFDVFSDRQDQSVINRAGRKQFILQHMQGTNPVIYSVAGWLKEVNREQQILKAATKLLQHSSKSFLNELLVDAFASRSNQLFFDTTGIVDGLQSIRSLQRSGGVKKKGSGLLKFKSTVDGIMEIFKKTEIHFVHSFLAQHHAGKTSLLSPNKGSVAETTEDLINIPLLRSQLRGSQTLEAARLHRFGYQSMPKAEFIQRFRLSGGPSIEQIVASNEIDTSSYRIGISQIFLRLDILNQLEAKRDDIISDSIKNFQSYCRGYLARQTAEKRRVHQLAIKCIQRNVRGYFAVKNWEWWRLYVKVVPLLNGNDNSMVQLRNAIEEQETLKKKMAKVEEERNLMNMENVRLKMKV